MSVEPSVSVFAVPKETPPKKSSTTSFKLTTDGRLTRTTNDPSAVSRTLSFRSAPMTERVGTSEIDFITALRVVTAEVRLVCTVPMLVCSVPSAAL